MKNILVIEHAPNRAAGILKHIASASPEMNCHVWQCFNTPSPPRLEFDALVLGGGPMMIEDLTSPSCEFFAAELDLIHEVVCSNKPVWGICLGAQIITHLFGGNVEMGKWILGWQKVHTTAEGQGDPLFSGTTSYETFQLHRDHISEIPAGAVALSTSNNSKYEAFKLASDSKVWASIFHPEIDIEQAQQIFDMKPELFTKNSVTRASLAPVSDGIEQRSRMFRNFVDLI